MSELAALAGFVFVVAATPGPNNVLLWASGAEFGFRRTLRHVVGTALGVALMAIAVAGGIGGVIAAAPALELVMKAAGSVYLLYLAYQVAGAHALERGDVARPLGLVQAVTFQAINPTGWIVAVGAVTTFRPAELPLVAGTFAVALVMLAVVIPSAALWAGAGDVLGGWIARERVRRPASLALGAVLAATVVYVWL